MPTSMPTRLLASPGGHPANATPWLESTPHPLYARRSFLIYPNAPRMGPAAVAAIPFRAQSAPSAHHE